MKIIRFISDTENNDSDENDLAETGRERYVLGRDLGNGSALKLSGNLTGSWEVTDRQERVARVLAPIDPLNIFCIGLNYRDHAMEIGVDAPQHPVVFMKPTSTVTHPGGKIRIPKCCTRGPEVDFEAELAVVIGKRCQDVRERDALDHVLGYTCANDVSARRWQKYDNAGQWVRGKSFDTFCPLGPCLVTPESIPDPQSLRITTTLNGQVMQDQSTSDMIFPVAKLISYLSQDTTLHPRTVILTGTPAGVGFTRDPRVFLQPGDEVVVEIDQIGRLVNHVV